MTLYKKKYRTETNRLRNHTYDEGTYFVTICTRKKLQWFGKIENSIMEPSLLGKIVQEEWLKTPKVRPRVTLDEWCLMPDHLHGIIVIKDVETSRGDVSPSDPLNTDVAMCDSLSTSANMGVSERVLSPNTDAAVPETRAPRVSTNKLHFQSASLGSIINQFKGAVTKRVRAKYLEFQWQSRYHDRIIRSEDELKQIKKYIAGNPVSWDKESIPWHADATSWNL